MKDFKQGNSQIFLEKRILSPLLQAYTEIKVHFIDEIDNAIIMINKTRKRKREKIRKRWEKSQRGSIYSANNKKNVGGA